MGRKNYYYNNAHSLLMYSEAHRKMCSIGMTNTLFSNCVNYFVLQFYLLRTFAECCVFEYLSSQDMCADSRKRKCISRAAVVVVRTYIIVIVQFRLFGPEPWFPSNWKTGKLLSRGIPIRIYFLL